MDSVGFTKSRSMGPIARAVERAGGSIARVFRRAELPLRLVEQPDRLILLRDQLTLVECAARETGDDALPVRLSIEGGMASLGSFGQRVCAAPRLEEAIARCNEGIGSMLQSMTRMRLARVGRWAAWTYGITDRAETGRQKNEMLALGYMSVLLRRFVRDKPVRAELPGTLQGKRDVENILGCDVTRGNIAALIFPAEWLQVENSALREEAGAKVEKGVPDPADLIAGVEQLIVLGLLDRRPDVAWVCRRLRMRERSLQRLLSVHETSFKTIKCRVLTAQAFALLKSYIRRKKSR